MESKTFIERMSIELSELNDKINKLCDFLRDNESPDVYTIYSIPSVEVRLLRTQLHIMNAYHDILSTRFKMVQERLNKGLGE